jgi:hypothetical protein
LILLAEALAVSPSTLTPLSEWVRALKMMSMQKQVEAGLSSFLVAGDYPDFLGLYLLKRSVDSLVFAPRLESNRERVFKRALDLNQLKEPWTVSMQMEQIQGVFEGVVLCGTAVTWPTLREAMGRVSPGGILGVFCSGAQESVDVKERVMRGLPHVEYESLIFPFASVFAPCFRRKA